MVTIVAAPFSPDPYATLHMSTVSAHPGRDLAADELAVHRSMRLRRISVEEYDGMIDSGVLQTSAGYELIHGLIVWKDRRSRDLPSTGPLAPTDNSPMAIGARHNWAVQGLGELSARLTALGCFLSTQGPLIVSADSEPEPDGIILLGTRNHYLSRKPTAADALAVFEVADTSLEADRTVKLRLYQAARIPHYVLVNLVEGRLEHYVLEGTAYRLAGTVARGSVLALPMGDRGTLSVPADDLLPPG